MLEILTTQVFHGMGHWQVFGKLFYYMIDPVRKQVESHAKPGATTLNVLIISDLLYGPRSTAKLEARFPELKKELPKYKGQENRALDFMQLAPSSVVGTIASFLPSLSGQWLRLFNEVGSDPGNFDLQALYTLLAEKSQLRWNIERTVYVKDAKPNEIIVESTACGVTRRSLFWDSDMDRLTDTDGKYDLILMRRGVCYCDVVIKQSKGAACCGAARHDDSDIRFLKKVTAALRPTDRSAAYLAGWNGKENSDKWQAAITKSAVAGELVKAYAEVVKHGIQTSGIYVSRGRKMSSNTLKSPSRS
jgi:hypothetical protein